VIWLAAITGARNSEIRGLRVSDFDPEAGWLGIERAISAGKVWTTKNRRYRDNALDDMTAAVVAAQIEWMAARAHQAGTRLSPDAYLFSDHPTGHDHWAEERITRYFGRLTERTGLSHLKFRYLRKFMDTYGQELGFTTEQVAARAGHDPTVARRYYTGTAAATDRRLSAALASALEEPGP
jgi:integrase